MVYGDIVEVFSSIQGEGKYVGYRQVFVRLAGCNLECSFCDTPTSRTKPAKGVVEATAGQRDFFAVTNPVGADQLTEHINKLLAIKHHSVSFTGGEPLCQADFIAGVAPKIKGKVFLETNGTLPERLTLVLPYIDIISMDIKLPSSSGQVFWQQHLEFLKLATAKDVFVKIVLTGQTDDKEFHQAIDLVAAVDPSIPVILQPVSPVNNVSGIAPEVVLKLQSLALTQLSDVRVIPQTHKMMGQL
jgi:organic radical activating enzyme